MNFRWDGLFQLLSKIRSRYDSCIYYLQLFQVVLTSLYRNWITKKRRLVSVRERMIRILQLNNYYHIDKTTFFVNLVVSLPQLIAHKVLSRKDGFYGLLMIK